MQGHLSPYVAFGSGGGNAAELHSTVFELVTVNSVYVPAKYGSREMHRMAAGMKWTSCEISPPLTYSIPAIIL